MTDRSEPSREGKPEEHATLFDEDAKAAPVAELLPGQEVGRYELAELLGEGAMGAVYAARDPMLDRLVALKILHPHQKGLRGAQRLQREAQALARISHPNVVTINDVGLNDERLYLAMELIDGQTLTEWLEQGPYPWVEVLAVMEQAGRGLGAVHLAGLVHRDFKPDNIMLTPDGRVLLADFGIAQADPGSTDDTEPSGIDMGSASFEAPVRLTSTGALMGTPRYMSPEQFLGAPTSPQSDQWAFCVVLWEALFGEHPFSGGTLAEIGLAVTTGARRDPPAKHGVPPKILRALERGLSTKARDRHSSMEALLGQLGRARPRPWRRWSIPAGLVVTGATVAALALAPRGSTRCDGGERMASVWNEARSAGVKQAFEASSLPLAVSAQVRVRRQLSEYRDGWVRAYDDACQVRAQASAEPAGQHDAIFGCLNERREAMDHLVAVLEQADDTVVHNAGAAVLGLGDVEGCAQAGPSEYAAGPSEPSLRREVDRVRAMLAEVQALGSAGLYDDSLTMAEQALEQALTIEYPPLHAAAWATLGGARTLAQGDALQALHTAVAIASAERLDEQVARISIALVDASLGGASDPKAARRWLRHAEAAIARLGHPPRLEASLLDARGRLCIHEGDYDVCTGLLERALVLHEEVYGARSLDVANSHAALGRLAARRGRYADATAHYEIARDIQEEELGAHHPGVVDTLSSIQDIARAQGDFARAEQIDAEVFPLLEAAYGPEHPRLMRTLAIRSSLLGAQGDHAGALRYLDRAIAIFERSRQPDHADHATLLSNQGVLLGNLGRHEEAVAALQQSLRINEEVYNATHVNVAVALDNLGFTLVEAGRPYEAVPLHQRALPIWEDAAPESPSLAISLTDHGRALYASDAADEALPLLERAVTLFESLTVDPMELARARLLLAQALVRSGGDQARARTLAQQALGVYAATPRSAKQREAAEAFLAELGAEPEPG